MPTRHIEHRLNKLVKWFKSKAKNNLNGKHASSLCSYSRVNFPWSQSLQGNSVVTL